MSTYYIPSQFDVRPFSSQHEDVRQWVRPSARGLKVFRVLAWIAAIAVLIGCRQMFFPTAPKPPLTDAQIQAARNYAQEKLNTGTAKGAAYSATDYALDSRELARIRDDSWNYRVTPTTTDVVRMSADRVINVLHDLALANEGSRITNSLNGETLSSDDVCNYANRMLMNAVMALPDRRRSPSPLPFFPKITRPATVGRLHWSIRLMRLFGLAWLASLIPAFWGVLRQLRRDGYSLRAEFILRPWRLIGLGVFWWFGLSHEAYEPGRDVVSVRLQRLEKQFRILHGREPDTQESAALRGQVTRPIASVEAVFERVREMPELAAVPTRRAVFTAWLLTCLNAPLQFITFVTTAVAQTTRTVAAQAAVTDTTARKPRGTLWGYFQTTVTEEAIELPMARLKGSIPVPVGTVAGEYRLESGRLKSLCVIRQATPSLTVEAGLITKPLTWDYLPPQTEPLPVDRLITLTTGLNDVGAVACVTRGGITCQASLTNGTGQDAERDHRPDLNLRLLQRAGPISGSVCWNHGGTGDDYRSVFAGFQSHRGNLELAHARRPDLNRTASRVRVKIPLRIMDLWLQGDRDRVVNETRDGASVAVERTWPFKSRVNLAASVREGKPLAWRLLFQQGIEFVSP